MLKIKKILIIMLAVCLLSMSVGSRYLDINHMTEVDAASLAAGAGITAATAFQVCLFIGAMVGTCYVVGEIIDNKEEIARAGKNFIDSVASIPEGWIMSMTDAKGQEYVLGSEAFELVQGMDWEVIQGGAGGDNNNDDDDDDDKKGWLNIFGPAEEIVGSFTALGATWFYDAASKLYQKWTGGEELTETEAAVIEPFVAGYCNQYDIAAQWSGEPFAYDAVFNFSGVFVTFGRYNDTVHFSFSQSIPYAAVFDSVQKTDSKGRLETEYRFYIYYYDTYYREASCVNLNCQWKSVRPDGTYISNDSRSGYSYTVGEAKYTSPIMSHSANFPVFGSIEEAEDYLKGASGVEDALNYAKVWRDADWLADDWQGILIDPLANIGLSLSQLIDLCKALNIHAVGNNITPAELADLIAESLPDVNPELLPDAAPSPAVTPNPDLQPIYFPYIDAHPALYPEPNPEPNPDINPDVPDSSDPELNNYKVGLSSVFPFCIPFDFIALLNVIDAEPTAPRFEFPVAIPALGYQETIIIDMSMFNDVAEIIRICETISFILFLMFSTSKVIRW